MASVATNKPIFLNPGHEELTPEKLITFPGLENLTGEHAISLTERIKDFARFCYNFITKQHGNQNATEE